MIKFRKKHKEKKIIDTSKQWTEPQRLPIHWAYLVYFGTALTCSMWQHAHPLLTLGLLVLLFPIGALAYIPYKFISSNTRFVGQLFCIIFAALWCFARLKMKIPVDKVLVEGLCIIAFCFIIAQRRNDYDYLLLVSIFLFLYGALLPRTIFLIAFSGGAILCALLLYSTRLKSISKQLDLKSPRRVFTRSWPQYLVHLFLTFAIFYYVFSLIPTQESEGEGLFASSFRTDNDSRLPPAFRKWFARGKVKKSPKGDSEVKTGSPTNVGKSGVPIKMKSDRKMSTPGKGGSGTPSKELIFRVKSPVKLYWAAQIYDIYDGDKWTFTKMAKGNNIRKLSNLNAKVTHYDVENKFIIEKWLSPKLYYAYRPIAFDLFDNGKKLCNYKESAFGVRLDEKVYPALPFVYNVTTVLYIPLLDIKKRTKCKLSEYWVDNLRPAHYMKLPRSKISWRVKRLVRRLTAGIKDPYQRAMKLRNYLRDNFKYKQYARPVPKGKEPVDYFLFMLREGHCEYFASSLAVMARLTGLPARVVTGFSPGNYNALNKYFEVHAYHAHAWTQIFIPGMGWLTMDGTPPGSIESRTTPFGIGSMRDPFGDTWRITPPEITPETIGYIRKKHYEKLEAERQAGKLNTYEEIFLATAQAQYKATVKFKDYMSKLKNYKERGLGKLKNIFGKIKNKLNKFFKLLKDRYNQLATFLYEHWFILIPIIAIIIALFLEILILKRYFKRKLGLRKSHVYYAAALKSFPDNPGKCVRMCYYMTRTLLNMGGFPRPRNVELFDYGRSLSLVDTVFYKDVVVIFFMFSKLEYSAVQITEEEAEDTLERVEKVRNFIYPLIHEEAELSDGDDLNKYGI